MAVYAVTDSCDIPYLTAGKKYKVENEDDNGVGFNIVGDNGVGMYCLWRGCGHLRGATWTRIEKEDCIALRHGDYVSTQGMTEDQYHAVARAFMEAGASAGEYPSVCHIYSKTLGCFGWVECDNCCFHGRTDGSFCDGRHLTINQVLNATNAGRRFDANSATLTINGEEQREMTPCENLGYKVGDRFEVTKNHFHFDIGDTAILADDDGSDTPIFYGNDGVPTYAVRLHKLRKLPADDHLNTTLTYARDELATAEHHERKAEEHRANHDGAMDYVRDMLPDGWRLVRDGEPDMSDPANWREGDVLECVEGYSTEFTEGRRYALREDYDGYWVSVKRDDEGDPNGLKATHFRFHHRPTGAKL